MNKCSLSLVYIASSSASNWVDGELTDCKGEKKVTHKAAAIINVDHELAWELYMQPSHFSWVLLCWYFAVCTYVPDVFAV